MGRLFIEWDATAPVEKHVLVHRIEHLIALDQCQTAVAMSDQALP